MFRQLVSALGVTVALGCIVVIGSTAALSNIVVPTSRAYATKASFDQVFIDVAAAARGDNTATYREKLRDLGWKHQKMSLAGK
jgi:hypothetical protein